MALAFPGRPTRRTLLVAACGLALPRIGVANDAESALRRAVRQGYLRFAIGAALPITGGSAADTLTHDNFGSALARLIAEGLGLRSAITPLGPAGSEVALVASDQADIGAIPLLAPPTIRRVLFSTPVTVQDMVVLGPGPRRWRGWEQMAALRLGALVQDSAVLAAHGLPLNTLSLLATDSLLLLERWLVEGAVDAVLASEAQARALRRRNPDAGLIEYFVAATFPFGLAVRLGEHDLLRALNAVLAGARQDGRLAALHLAHLGRPAPNIDLL